MAMAPLNKTHTLLSCLPLLFFLSAAHPCANHRFPDGKTFTSCHDLGALGCFLHWNYSSPTNQADVAFRCPGVDDSSWVSWAINPASTAMIGSQAFVSFRRIADGSLTAYTAPIKSYETQLQQGNLSFPVHAVSAISDGKGITIFASFQLPNRNTTIVNDVWQVGPVVAESPGIHQVSGSNFKSFGTLDFLSGRKQSPTTTSGNGLKILHGAMNTIGWGLMMPIGVLIARYMKRIEGEGSAVWFNVHVRWQSCAGLIGLMGAAVGFWLNSGGGSRAGYHGHGTIGIALVCSLISQVVVGRFMRPKKEDKKRIYWNVFHYLVGYGIVVMSAMNCFSGLVMLEGGSEGRWPGGEWYLGGIGLIGLVALGLEAWTRGSGGEAPKSKEIDSRGVL